MTKWFGRVEPDDILILWFMMPLAFGIIIGIVKISEMYYIPWP